MSSLPSVEALKSRLNNAQPIIEQICSIMGQVGLAYGVLYRGQVVLARGHGYRDAENKTAADESTLFNVASCTKAFTATACALMVKEGSLDLEVPVKIYLPELEEEEATLVDLLAHRTGYARLDMSWVGQHSEVLVSHGELIRRVNALPRLRSLRKPPFAPGGGIENCVVNMLNWAQLLLDAYEADKQHASPKSDPLVNKHPDLIFSPKMILPGAISHGQLERSYGMGFMRLMLPSKLSCRGRNATVAASVAIPPLGVQSAHTLTLSHAGENAGALSAFTLFPELDAAMIVPGNTTALGDANELVMHLLGSQILDPDPQIDYTEVATHIADQCANWHDRAISTPLSQHQILGTQHGPLLGYVGLYKGLEYTIKVILEDGGLILNHGGRASQRARLTHYHYDTFSFATSDYEEHMQLGMIDYDDWRLLLVQFERDYRGAVVGIKCSSM
ncbi:beta-lactamase/transpeptidase-like protein [Ophiobolus disseminans]|uniref:Beta-lactamase/transpeptidase-like protein n=1 Tax=Ophiobolus disseminans TaxID=1469910 RepID=A0A6A6ZUH8_9PLEO|nr:beta-lactamase/transpeptidase-like protein [Ophiobolus disseminans]